MSRSLRSTTQALFLCAFFLSAGASLAASAETERSELSAELFYQLLLSDLSLQNDDPASAFSLMLDAARKAHDPRLYERAVELALRARDANGALNAANAWQRAYPQSPDADRYLLQLLIGLNRLEETGPPLQRSLANFPVNERKAAITQLARLFSRANNKKLAADILEKYLQTDLRSTNFAAPAWAAVGQLRLLADDKAAALSAAQKGALAQPDFEEIALLALNLWDFQTPAVQSLLKPYFSGKPSADMRMGYVRKLLDIQAFDDALSQLVLLCSEKPNFADAWLLRGSIELEKKMYPSAEKSLLVYLALNPDPPSSTTDGEAGTMARGVVQTYFLLSQMAELKKDFKEAQAYLARIKSPPDAAKIQLRRALLLGKQGNWDEARGLIRNLPETQADDSRFKINAELQLLREHQQDRQAYRLLTEALQRFPGDPDFTYELAMSADKLGRAGEMEKILRALIAAKPEYYAAYNALGYSLADRNTHLGEARTLIAKALEFAPNDPFILDSLAWLEFRSGNLQLALSILEKAFQARPDAEIAAHLGEVYWSLNQREQAQRIWKQGLELNSDNETLKSTIRRLPGRL